MAACPQKSVGSSMNHFSMKVLCWTDDQEAPAFGGKADMAFCTANVRQ